MRDVLDGQRQHWEQTFADQPMNFGETPSTAAAGAAELFPREGTTDRLELGGGHGRDTLFFVRSGVLVHVLDYSKRGLGTLADATRGQGLGDHITPACHEVRAPLPFPGTAFDACYSHMLLCMALTTTELAALSAEAWRVLRLGGLHIYTVRHTGDPHDGTGGHCGEDRYDTGGFVVHLFTWEKVERPATGFDLVGNHAFEEGSLPRRLFRVTLRKPTAVR